MLKLQHVKHGECVVSPHEGLLRVLDLLDKGYKLIYQQAPGYTVYYISVQNGDWWIRPGQAADSEPRLRTNSATRTKPERSTLSVPMYWVRQPSSGCSSLKLVTTGFGVDYFYPCRETSGYALERCIASLKEKLCLGNTCLELPNRTDVIISFTNDGKNRFCVEPSKALYSVPTRLSKCSLFVPESFTTTQQKEIPMDLLSVLMAEELFAVTVVFSNSSTEYTYKSTVEYAPGTKVVVDTPSNGLVVVTVKHCAKGLDINVDKFAAYKWVVDSIDMEEYDRLRDLEVSLVQKAKARKRLEGAKKQLEELGLTEAEIMAMVKNNG